MSYKTRPLARALQGPKPERDKFILRVTLLSYPPLPKKSKISIHLHHVWYYAYESTWTEIICGW
jgi:hypothetical protein